ncbi:hypothetical protein EKN38_12845 [Enterobacter sp. WCHEn045836]|uniref:MrpH family fimbial adhesin n=1 Tax=Enterobacter sp. WCHEn045836 TaxID=2497434 RepID=UPI000F84D236|nr:hypothetical protein [Enterobacter sp. WCHEn045836]RTQ01259.1 hypothetical protein EKN38_12845 [Enterobacter sp. WCHEn045836]
MKNKHILTRKAFSLLLLMAAHSDYANSTIFDYTEWSSTPAIFVTAKDPTDDMKSLNDSYNCDTNNCKYGLSAYVIMKNGERIEGSGGFTFNESWGATGREQIIAYLQRYYYSNIDQVNLPRGINIKDIKETCFTASIVSRNQPTAIFADTCISGGGKPPPIPGQPFCDVQNNLVLEHGTLTTDEINGHRVEKQIAYQCNEDITGELLIKTPDIKMGGANGDIRSNVLINGKSSLQANMLTGSNVFSVSSTLAMTGKPDAGEYFGSTVLVWTPN